MARKDCPACYGSGNCQKCDGDGRVRGLAEWALTFGLATQPCPKCNESGKCTRCKGKGNIPRD
jgi:DnaJ-class molecular chaperone